MFIDAIYLNEEVEVRVVCSLKVGRYTTERNVVEQLLFLDAHHVHAHGAGDHLHAILYRLLDQALQAVDPLVAHDHPHQAAAHAHHVEFRQFELSAVGREHHAEHFAKQVFRYGWLLPFLDDVQAPEGEEEADLLSRGGRPVGDDKRGERLVQVVAEDDNGLVLTGDRFPYRWLRPFFLRIVAFTIPSWLSSPTSSAPVVLHQAATSLPKAWSVAEISNRPSSVRVS